MFPIFENFSSINNDESGSIIISKNNWNLAHSQEDYEKVLNAIEENKKKNAVNDASTIIIIDKS